MRRSYQRRNELICRIDVTAFLSIQLVLLFIFIVAAGDRPDLPMNSTSLAKVAHSVPIRGAIREDAMVVAVQRDGNVWLGNHKVSSDQLATEIREALSQGAERKVYINADAHAHYGSVLKVLCAVRSAGVENVGFLVDERGTPSKAFYHSR